MRSKLSYRIFLFAAVAVLLPGLCRFGVGLAQEPEPTVTAPATAPAGTQADPAGDGAGNTGQSLFSALLSPVSLLIIVLSIGAIALVVEHAMTIRESVLIPPGLSDGVRRLLMEGKISAARLQARAEPSPLAFVLDAAISEAEGGWTEVEKAAEDAIADQSARLFRKIEYLSVIGNIAPMLGLLGTVIGMMFTFASVSETQGTEKAPELAGGIYLALTTTVEGLIVAIPALGAFAVFRSRVDQLIAELTYTAQHTLRPLKRPADGSGARRQAGPSRPTAPQAPPATGGAGRPTSGRRPAGDAPPTPPPSR